MEYTRCDEFKKRRKELATLQHLIDRLTGITGMSATLGENW